MVPSGKKKFPSVKYISIFLEDKSYLGDQITLIPFFYFLRKINPDHTLVVIANQKASVVLHTLGYIDELYAYQGKIGMTKFIHILKELRKKNIETAFTHRRHSVKFGLLARLAVGKQLVGFSARTTNIFLNGRIKFDHATYVAQNYLRMVGHHLKVFSSEFERECHDYFLLIPCGSAELKKYPIAKYINIAKILRRTAPVHFLLGKDMVSEIIALTPFRDTFELHIGKPLGQVEDIVKKASVVIANDCGPAHFAHIYDIPRVCLFAPQTNIKKWFHPTKYSVLIVSPSNHIEAIKEEKVFESALCLYNACQNTRSYPNNTNSKK